MEANYVYYRQSRPLYRGVQVVWYIINIIEVILLLRLMLRLIGASTEAAFTNFIYGLASPLMTPFQSIVPSYPIGIGVFDWNTTIAMLAYWILGLILTELFVIGKPVSAIEAHRKLESQKL